jgi:uncharacterized circularly permuted ATP-grasp superfamily protein
MAHSWQNYQAKGFYDELINEDHTARLTGQALVNFLKTLNPTEMENARHVADLAVKEMGITFTVYGEGSCIDRSWPIDIIPRVIHQKEWQQVEIGLKQRVKALNMFIDDIYHDQRIVNDGVFPKSLLEQSVNFRKECVGITPKNNIWAHICGSDLVRDGEGVIRVLEDNLRVPSGVSYMLENRETMLQMFPELFSQIKVQPVSNYPKNLRRSLAACAPAHCAGKPTVAILTPGIHNSAYFEHSFLADQMGVELVEGHDLRVVDGHIAMRTTEGYKVIDVLYRRVDDDYLDPLNFNPDSMLGVPGIMDVYRAGNITIANAPGTGISDDKAIYSYMPDIIEFYTGEKAILKNVETYRCSEPDSLKYVLDNLANLVVKEVHGSGGYGMLVGPAANKRELADFADKLRARPSNYIAQPTLSLSTVPIFAKKGLAPRHVDLRPFALMSPKGIDITAGGLTRVALKDGSLVVNSSQGGGTKDTWVLEA